MADGREQGAEDGAGGAAEAAFTLLQPASPGRFVFASPHSGEVYPADMGAAPGLDPASLRSAGDALVDRLIAPGLEAGAPLLLGRLGRAYVDLNRDPDDLDPALIDGLDGRAASPRAAAGYGVIPRLTGDGRPLYARRLGRTEAADRIARVHAPYHAALERLMREAHARHGEAVLVDWHSMPARATQGAGGARGPDVVLGDRHGSSCSAGVTRLLRAQFERAGWRVALNRPYAGGWSTQLWGRPDEGLHAVQVELNRALYLNEDALTPGPHFVMTQKVIRRVTAALAAHDWSRLRPHAQAAE